MNFEERIHLLGVMKKKGIKQKDLAKFIDKSKALISFYFSGKQNLNETDERKIIDYINNH